jgi:hypothetical protein
MDVNNLGKLQPASTNPGRPQNVAKATPRAASGSSVQTLVSTQATAPASFGDDGGQPDAPTPRGSLLDVLV